MGQIVMVIGESGSGKSTSLRNFKKEDLGVFNVAGKRMPFRSQLMCVDKPDYAMIINTLKANNKKCYVIDDSTYLMQFENFKRAKETGYTKFTDMALHFQQLLSAAIETDEDTIVYFLHHPQFIENGTNKPQTIGKMLDNQLNMEGLFPIVIECRNEDGKHLFYTNNEGISKSPMDMLPSTMDNDLAEVDKLIREYWQMKPLNDKKEGAKK